jgi:DNA-binding HxlR family transcriptional regulator
MKAYGQFCPLAQSAQLLCERWTILIIREFIAGSTRFSDLRKGLPLLSPTLLSTRLKQLVEAGVLERRGNKNAYSYQLTQAGMELRPIIEFMGAWGHRWARSRLTDEDLDAGLLMWDMRRSVDTGIFPEHRIIIQFEYPDAPEGNKNWWLVSENREIDLCKDDPGFDVDVLITCSLKTMTAIWTCQRKFNDAIRNKEVDVKGPKALTKDLQSWLCSSLLSKLGTITTLPGLDWTGSFE